MPVLCFSKLERKIAGITNTISCMMAYKSLRASTISPLKGSTLLVGCAPPPAPARPPVKLSAGVALAQTGPEGTLMSFSVDYRFLDVNRAFEHQTGLENAVGRTMRDLAPGQRRAGVLAVAAIPQHLPAERRMRCRVRHLPAPERGLVALDHGATRRSA